MLNPILLEMQRDKSDFACEMLRIDRSALPQEDSRQVQGQQAGAGGIPFGVKDVLAEVMMKVAKAKLVEKTSMGQSANPEPQHQRKMKRIRRSVDLVGEDPQYLGPKSRYSDSL
jgi:hypothetical protein